MSYTEPTPDQVRQSYPLVAGVSDTDIQFWLNKVDGISVDQSWPDYGADAQIAAAVHRMIRAGVQGITRGAAAGALASGLSRWRSGTADLQFSDAATQQAAAGGWSSTQAGQDYLELLRRFAAGPRVSAPGRVLCDNVGFNGFAGPLSSAFPYGHG